MSAFDQRKEKILKYAIAILGLILLGGLLTVGIQANLRADSESARASATQAEKVDLAEDASEALCRAGDIKVYEAALCERLETAAAEPIPGEQGPRGAQGPPGPPGEDGRDGSDGKQGPSGKDGTDGIDGLDGTNGSDGLDGKQGPPGPIGPAGPPGTPGEDGSDGSDGAPGEPPVSWTQPDPENGGSYHCTRVEEFNPDAPKYTCSYTPAS